MFRLHLAMMGHFYFTRKRRVVSFHISMINIEFTTDKIQAMTKVKCAKFTIVFCLTQTILLSGCATIVEGTTQGIWVHTAQNGKSIPQIDCKLENDRGKWQVVTPDVAYVNRSATSLQIECSGKPDLFAKESIKSNSNGALIGNMAATGPIGAAIDTITGAGFSYPKQIQINLKKISSAIEEESSETK